MIDPGIPVYLFTGFLDSGKTVAIKDFILGIKQHEDKKVLLIICEEGDEEFDEIELASEGVDIRYIDDEADLTYEYIGELQTETSPDCVIVEYNGMWNVSRPRVIWDPEQILEIMLIDTSTFEIYLTNLKALIADKIRTADLIIFNRCNDANDRLPYYRRSARALNQRANIVFRNDNGDIDFDPSDFLPYDISLNHLTIDDDTFASFFIDAMENPDRYTGKTVDYSGMVLNSEKNGQHSLLLGRLALTCCSEDLSVFGLICDIEEDTDLEVNDWINVTCVIDKEYSDKFQVWYPICIVKEYARCAPREKIINVN